MAVLKIRDEHGNVREVTAIKGEKGADGKDYVLTDADKQEIADIVASKAGYVTEAQLLAIVQANTPVSGDGESY